MFAAQLLFATISNLKNSINLCWSMPDLEMNIPFTATLLAWLAIRSPGQPRTVLSRSYEDFEGNAFRPIVPFSDFHVKCVSLGIPGV